MNADKSSVKTYAVEMIIPKPGHVFLMEWTKSDKGADESAENRYKLPK